jgi:hypothetical protein
MKRSKECAEAIVRLDFNDQTANICVCEWPAMASKFRRMFGPPSQESGDRAWFWTVTISQLSIHRKRKGSKNPSFGSQEKV